MSNFYRKYRPQKFSELFGQEVIKNLLFKSLQQGKLSQAYLFSGPRGVGKTATARILAKSLVCQQNDEVKQGFVEPCTVCANCLSIREGNYLDLVEVDAASNRGIDEIRDLREKVRLAPTEGKYKIYIIDEAHMLTNEAFNALLKTLEEPPLHAVFILCTTDPQKLPSTVISRCQRYDFKRANRENLMKYLRHLVNQENLDLEEGVLDLVSQKAEGSYRDAAKLLDQISSQNQRVALKFVREFFSFGGEEVYANFVGSLTRRDTAEAVSKVNKLFENGWDLREFNRGLLEYLRKLLVIKAGAGEGLIKPTVAEELYEEMSQSATSLSKPRLIHLITLFTQSEESLKFTPIPQLPLELAVVESCILKEDEQGVSRKTKDGQNQEKSSGKVKALEEGQESVVSELKRESEIDFREELLDTQEVDICEQSLSTEEKKVPIDEAGDSGKDLAFIKQNWLTVLKTVKPHNHSLEAMLKGCEPVSFDGRILTLRFSYRFHKERLESPKNTELLEKILSEVISSEIKIKCSLGDKKISRKVDREEADNVTAVDDKDLIKSAADIFNGNLL
jgi:DNA polymerase-3 subunit gamma/tau